ncbi:hypothetical protein T07_10077 [Trichinella nelsoni]|uniref:Uncharacterized protein n=1 Tax=Trichinella nelsoni TaxID=6336 RepID=A0A0V0SHM9_9BILA|nr:hypothetical protein T07_10077 [Trichinella nelsoni]
MNRSIDRKENREYCPLRMWKTFLENVIQYFFDKLLPHRNNAMPLSALICRFRSVRFKPIRKFDGHLVKIYRRLKRTTQVEISKKLFPDFHDRRKTEQTCSNVYINSHISINICLVDHFVGFMRESEAWHKIIGRLVVRKQVQKVLIKLMIVGLAAPLLQLLFDKRWRCVTKVQLQDATFSSISNLRKPVFNATCAVNVFYANWLFEN